MFYVFQPIDIFSYHVANLPYIYLMNFSFLFDLICFNVFFYSQAMNKTIQFHFIEQRKFPMKCVCKMNTFLINFIKVTFSLKCDLLQWMKAQMRKIKCGNRNYFFFRWWVSMMFHRNEKADDEHIFTKISIQLSSYRVLTFSKL